MNPVSVAAGLSGGVGSGIHFEIISDARMTLTVCHGWYVWHYIMGCRACACSLLCRYTLSLMLGLQNLIPGLSDLSDLGLLVVIVW